MNPTGQEIGEVWYRIPEIPLLIKFLFTTDKLSVQVHPDDAYALAHGKSAGKTEMWHILAAQPGAKIAAGFREPISEDRLRAAAISGEIEDLLEWHDARPGDTFFIPAGTVHAIGGGLTICEIQQNSDVTYRLYDYNRKPARELHLDHGVRVSKLCSHAARQAPVNGVLVDCAHFRTTKVIVDGCLRIAPQHSELWVAISGGGTFAGEAFQAGEVWSASAGAACDIEGRAELLRASVPGPSPR